MNGIFINIDQRRSLVYIPRTITAVPTKLTVSCCGIVTYSFAYSPRVHRAICKFSLHGISIHDDTTEGSHMMLSKHMRRNASKYRVKCYLVQSLVYNGILNPSFRGSPRVSCQICRI